MGHQGHGESLCQGAVPSPIKLTTRPAERRSQVATKAEARAINLPVGVKKVFDPQTWPVFLTTAQAKSGERESTPDCTIGLGHQPIPQSTPGIGEERVRRPEARTRYVAPSSMRESQLDPTRSCSVASCGSQGKESSRYRGRCPWGIRESSRTRFGTPAPRWTRALLVANSPNNCQRFVVRKDAEIRAAKVTSRSRSSMAHAMPPASTVRRVEASVSPT